MSIEHDTVIPLADLQDIHTDQTSPVSIPDQLIAGVDPRTLTAAVERSHFNKATAGMAVSEASQGMGRAESRTSEAIAASNLPAARIGQRLTAHYAEEWRDAAVQREKTLAPQELAQTIERRRRQLSAPVRWMASALTAATFGVVPTAFVYEAQEATRHQTIERVQEFNNAYPDLAQKVPSAELTASEKALPAGLIGLVGIGAGAGVMALQGSGSRVAQKRAQKIVRKVAE